MSSSTQSTISTKNTRAATSQWIRGVVFTALFGALFIAGSYLKVSIGFTPVPITLQSLTIMLAGGLLGAVYGFWSIFIVILLTATGLPLMGEGSGLSKIFGATGGFIWMFPFAAFLIGFVTDKLFTERKRLSLPKVILLFVSIFGFGSLLLYVTGIPWLAHFSATLDLQGAIEKGMVPFLTGDLIKAIVATLIIASIRPVLPLIRPQKKSQ
ncbi:MAG: biotin transporter BioY [Candidatus Cohnella colombiensis]|uniref:Biotin transporter n=1 Tax=Candidatus Cohnella colombiensis TaxID=3121368 RepID=A0AA95JH63_9BACL|nr:MAG: biotin transporter BioY [Cohnella sp.]